MKLQKSLKRKGLLSLAKKALSQILTVNPSIAVEEKSDLSLLTKVNSFHHTVRNKKELISELDCALEKLNDELKNI